MVVEKAMSKNTMEKVYLDAQAACGLQVGDWVKVLRRFATREGGCVAGWDIMYNASVGKVFQICEISDMGVHLELGADWVVIFPYFVLEKTENPAHEFRVRDEVLVRDYNDQRWAFSIFSHYDDDHTVRRYKCVSGAWSQCIPYEGNQHLLGTINIPE